MKSAFNIEDGKWYALAKLDPEIGLQGTKSYVDSNRWRIFHTDRCSDISHENRQPELRR